MVGIFEPLCLLEHDQMLFFFDRGVVMLPEESAKLARLKARVDEHVRTPVLMLPKLLILPLNHNSITLKIKFFLPDVKLRDLLYILFGLLCV